MITVNRTRDYHLHYPIDLMTEFTVCESLSHVRSPYMAALERPIPYGTLVGNALRNYGILVPGCSLCEIGGGYGTLMHGFLEAYASVVRRVCMVDLSPFLLKKQRTVLERWAHLVTFIHADAMEMVPALSQVDCFILNEMVGDLDTYRDCDVGNLPQEVSELIDRYSLAIPSHGTFHFNYGALRLLEGLCERGIPAFIVEHSSDPIIPDDMTYLHRDLVADGFPREIQLRGHSEFTIRFAHLVKVAEYWGRKVVTGSLIDLVGLKRTPDMRFIFMARACATERHEVIFELLDHIREYRWLIAM